MKVPRRSAKMKRTSRRILRWWEMVDCPSGNTSTISQTHTGSALCASRLRMRIRVGSAIAFIQDA